MLMVTGQVSLHLFVAKQLYMALYKVVIFVLIFQSCVSKSVVNLKSNLRRKNTGFLLSMPKTLVSGKNETICLMLHQAKLPAKILVDLKWKEQHHTTLKAVAIDSTCFDIEVPLKKILEPQFISVRVQMQINAETYSAHNQDPILVYPNQQHKIFIETDRGVYKPGDTVKFRILKLNAELLPISQKISNIKIKNPMGLTVMAWQDLTPNHGLINMEYQMVSEALTGKWNLQVDNQTKQFEVAKYNVPRFKIDIKYPKIVYYKAESMNIVVCGRYSYNKPVAGIAFVKISDSFNNMKSVNKFKEMVDGCSEFPISATELNLDAISEKTFNPKNYLHITATITEQGTNKMDVATAKSKIVLKGYNLKFYNKPVFIPGVPYNGQLKLTNNITSTLGEIIEICYNLAIKKSWNYFNDEQCQNYTVLENGIIPFKLWPFKNSVLHVHLHAKSRNNSLIADSFLLIRLFSPSSSYIQIEKDASANYVCNTQYRYRVSYSSDHFNNGDNVTFYYTVKSPTELLQMDKYVHVVRKVVSDTLTDEHMYLGQMHKYVKLSTSTDQFYLTFELSKRFITKYQFLVYYVTREGETVATTKSEEIEPCSLMIKANWNHNQLLPGAMATLNIKSAAPALCAVSATDKSTKFMSANHQTVNMERILKVFSPDRESARSGRNSCILTSKKSQGPSALLQSNESELWESRRRKRHIYSFSEDYDAYDVFSRFGVVTITNLQVVTKPCYSGPLVNDSYQVQFLTDHYETAQEEGSQVTIRSYFPENWLWELVPVANFVQLQRNVPHSITNWVTNVLCVSDTDGIGFSEETELSSFQPFFVDILAPYSIKKGENLNLLVHISNYVNYTFPIRISIQMSSNVQLTNQISATYCLKENTTQTHIYPLIGVEIGVANITVMVENESQFPLPCGPETIVAKRDVVHRSFKIEPEGYFMTSTKSALLCASNENFDNNVTWNLVMPKDIVAGTNKATASINAELLGQTIENLDQLLTIPSGCGEQIMASMAPNIYVMRFMNATGALTSPSKQRIIRNLKMGYQRILNYAHNDGSFSAFGYYDPSGSMFLTAFVVKVLQEAKNFIYIDQRVIDKAVAWIFDHQLENGCFDTMYHVFQDMGGTNMENSTAGLTSYVILSLFDAKVNVPDTVQTNAKYCIRSQHNPDKYSLVISSYALFKVHWISEARRFMERAVAVSNMENNVMWWSTRGNDESSASDIEITSYALLAMMQQQTAENMAYAHSIAQWLMSKMGPTGGFKSTQDTIVALDGLAKYIEYIRSYSLDLNVNLEAHQESHIFAIHENDKLKSKQVILHNEDGEVKVFLRGRGCALIQLTVSYYTLNISESEAFNLAVEVSPVSNIDECSIKSISPCVAYKGPDKLSNMAVMEIALPSGFAADRSSLYELVEAGNKQNIKMFEEKESQINIYFTNLGKNQVCFSFKINEHLSIENRKDTLVKLYDYYRPEQNILQFYKIINNCSRITIGGLMDGVQYDYKPESYYVFNSANIASEALHATFDDNNNNQSNKCFYVGENKTEQNSIISYELDVNQTEQDNLELPKCVHVALNKERSKRGIEAKKSDNKENPMLNKDFVDLDIPVEPEAPNCMNIPFYTLYTAPAAHPRNKRDIIWLRYTRSSGGLNKDFMDSDIDMEAPNCVNIPFYAPFPSSKKKNTTSSVDNQGIGTVRHSGTGPHPLQPTKV